MIIIADLKIKSKAKLKKVDRFFIGTQKLKENIVKVKNDGKSLSTKDSYSANEYGTDVISNNIQKVTKESIEHFNRYGKKELKKSPNNIKKLKSRTKQVKNNFKFERRKLKNTKKNLNNAKITAKVTKQGAKKAYEITKLTAKAMIKETKIIAKAVVEFSKAVVAGIKELIALIVSGGWIAVVILVVLCAIISIFGIFLYNFSNEVPIVEVAISQVGNIGGEPYWSWYGFDERVEWCACFVSWCANECGYLENNIFSKFSVCDDGVNWFKERNLWIDRNNIASSGNIIFFDWVDETGNRNNSADHVGIVEKVENNIVYTIEGNSEDRCMRRKYDINSLDILGYGIITYQENTII